MAIRFLILTILPASFLLTGLSFQVLSLFSGGGSYLSAVPVLQLVSVTYIFAGVQSVIFSLFQAVAHTTRVLLLGIVSIALDLGLSILLVPQYGIIGGAESKVLETVLGAMLAIYLARSYLKKVDSKIFYFKGLLASMVPFIVVLVLSVWNSEPLTLIPYSIVGLAAFLFSVRALKLLNEEDKAHITHLIPVQLHRFLRYL